MYVNEWTQKLGRMKTVAAEALLAHGSLFKGLYLHFRAVRLTNSLVQSHNPGKWESNCSYLMLANSTLPETKYSSVPSQPMKQSVMTLKPIKNILQTK